VEINRLISISTMQEFLQFWAQVSGLRESNTKVPDSWVQHGHNCSKQIFIHFNFVFEVFRTWIFQLGCIFRFLNFLKYYFSFCNLNRKYKKNLFKRNSAKFNSFMCNSILFQFAEVILYSQLAKDKMSN